MKVRLKDRNAECDARDWAHFAIGDIDVSLRSELVEARDDFADLYDDCRQQQAPARSIRIEVKRAGRSLTGGRRFDILGDGQVLFRQRRRQEVLPYIEWGINWRVIASRGEFLQLHAAAMVRSGHAMVLVAASGAGKSTLAAGLLQRGWRYLSDEFALINPDTMHVHPFPKALCIKAGSFPVAERLGIPLWRNRHYVKAFKGRVGYVRPHGIAGDRTVSSSPLRFVVFPRYYEDAQPRLNPISRAEAAFKLSQNVLNRSQFPGCVTSSVCDVVRHADCLKLMSGPIGPTCDLIESLMS